MTRPRSRNSGQLIYDLLASTTLGLRYQEKREEKTAGTESTKHKEAALNADQLHRQAKHLGDQEGYGPEKDEADGVCVTGYVHAEQFRGNDEWDRAHAQAVDNHIDR